MLFICFYSLFRICRLMAIECIAIWSERNTFIIASFEPHNCSTSWMLWISQVKFHCFPPTPDYPFYLLSVPAGTTKTLAVARISVCPKDPLFSWPWTTPVWAMDGWAEPVATVYDTLPHVCPHCCYQPLGWNYTNFTRAQRLVPEIAWKSSMVSTHPFPGKSLTRRAVWRV